MDVHTLKPAASLAKYGKTPFPGESEEYSRAREELLAEEIEFRRHMTRLTEQRRLLPPGPAIKKNYRFKDANGAEFDLIDWIRSQQRTSALVQLPAADDLAVLRWNGDDLLLVGTARAVRRSVP